MRRAGRLRIPGRKVCTMTAETIAVPREATTAQDVPVAHADEEAFHIVSDEAAEWLLRTLANLEEEKARIQAQVAKILKRLDNERAGLLFLYEQELATYVREKLAAQGN